MKKVFVISLISSSLFVWSCNNSDYADADDNKAIKTEVAPGPKQADPPAYDPHRGEGKFMNVEVSPSLSAAMATDGEKVYSVKCSGCHKLTDERLVGPGWAGVSTRRTPEWIMNFVTNTEEMLNKDPEAQAQLEICLVRMPNQNLTDDEARNVFEYMRKNDGVK